MTPLPVQRAGAAIDDMEHGVRTQLDTLRVNGTDAGVDHSAMLMLPVVRGDGDHALLVSGTTGEQGASLRARGVSADAGRDRPGRPQRLYRSLVRCARRSGWPAAGAGVPRAQYGCLCRAVHSGWRVADSEDPVREFTAAGGQRGYVGREGRASADFRTGGNCRFECLDGIGQRTVLLKEVLYGGSQRLFGSRGRGGHRERGSRSATGGERRHSGAHKTARRRQLGAAILRRQGTAAVGGSAGKPQSVPLQQFGGQVEGGDIRKRVCGPHANQICAGGDIRNGGAAYGDGGAGSGAGRRGDYAGLDLVFLLHHGDPGRRAAGLRGDR